MINIFVCVTLNFSHPLKTLFLEMTHSRGARIQASSLDLDKLSHQEILSSQHNSEVCELIFTSMISDR